MSFLKKMAGVFAFYLFSPVTVWLHRLRGVVFEDPKSTFIGIHVDIDHLHPECVRIGRNVTIAGGARITAHISPPKSMRTVIPEETRDVVVGSNVFIGADVIVLPGVTIGDWVVVGAGSVVTKDVPAHCVVAGNPASFIKSLPGA